MRAFNRQNLHWRVHVLFFPYSHSGGFCWRLRYGFLFETISVLQTLVNLAKDLWTCGGEERICEPFAFLFIIAIVM